MLDRSGEIRMAGPRTIDVLEPLEFCVFVNHLEGERAAERRAPPHAREERHGVGLDPLPAAASVAALPSHEFVIEGCGVDREPRGKPVDEGHERGAMGFTGGPIAEHECWESRGGGGTNATESSFETKATLERIRLG